MEADLIDVDFVEYADLIDVELVDADLIEVDFVMVPYVGADLMVLALANADLVRAELMIADLGVINEAKVGMIDVDMIGKADSFVTWFSLLPNCWTRVSRRRAKKAMNFYIIVSVDMPVNKRSYDGRE